LSDEADAKLQDCFAITDRNMFRDSSDDIEEYTTSVTGIINKCIEDVVPIATVRTYPNQKPWITDNILVRKLTRNPAMPCDEPPNRQSVNTGLRLNRLRRSTGLANYYRLQREAQPRAAQ
jgi:hypothetical protein